MSRAVEAERAEFNALVGKLRSCPQSPMSALTPSERERYSVLRDRFAPLEPASAAVRKGLGL